MMQNFREKYTYTFSLYLLLILSIYQFIFFIVAHICNHFGYVVPIYILKYSSFLVWIFYLISIIMRFFSRDTSKSWMDLIFYLFISISLSLFYILRPFEFSSEVVYLFVFTSSAFPSFFTIKYLFELRKRENLVTE